MSSPLSSRVTLLPSYALQLVQYRCVIWKIHGEPWTLTNICDISHKGPVSQPRLRLSGGCKSAFKIHEVRGRAQSSIVLDPYSNVIR